MEESKKQQVIAEVENVENIKDFFTEWWSVENLYETAAKANAVAHRMALLAEISQEEHNVIMEFIEQHIMMIDLMKKFAPKHE